MTRTIGSLLLTLVFVAAGGCGNAVDRPDGRQETPESWDPPNETAPDVFRALFETTEGDFVVEVHRDWAPHGADRFYNLVREGYFDGCRFFRVVSGFVVQWGINGDPRVYAKWNKNIPPDKVVESNKRGMVTFAMAGSPDTRSVQVFINLGNNQSLDDQKFAPFGKVVEGMDVVEKFYGGYGEGPPTGRGPDQQQVMERGNAYLSQNFPLLDSIEKATIVDDKKSKEPKEAKTGSPNEKKTKTAEKSKAEADQ